MRELVRYERKGRERERLGAQVLEGQHSGDPHEITPQTWEELRQKVGDHRNLSPQACNQKER